MAQKLLTPRESVILASLDSEETLAQIAQSLWVTRNTVKSQTRTLYRKLGVSSREAAIAEGRRLGLFSA